MIDGIKIVLPEQYQQVFLENPLLETEHRINSKNGEVTGTDFIEYIGLRIYLVTKGVMIKGSLHKSFNLMTGKGYQNYNDFNFEDLNYVIDMLSELLQFKLEDAIIQTIEFGVNIHLSVLPTRFLDKNMIIMKDRKPVATAKFNSKGSFTEFEFSQYHFKIYDKGRQYKQKKNILRVEIKVKKSQFIINNLRKNIPDTMKEGMKLTLSHLSIPILMDAIKTLLIKHTKELIIIDDFEENVTDSQKDQKLLLQGSNPNYWSGLHEEVSKPKFRLKRSQFKKLLVKYGLNKLHQEIMNNVERKWDSLSDAKCSLFTHLYSVNTVI